MKIFMKAARVYKPGEIVIEDVPIPEIGEKDVLIKVHRAGICGTDVGVVQVLRVVAAHDVGKAIDLPFFYSGSQSNREICQWT